MNHPMASSNKNIIFFNLLDLAEKTFRCIFEETDESFIGSSLDLAKDLINQFHLVRMLATSYPAKTIAVGDPLQKLSLFNHIVEEVANLQLGLFGLSGLNANENITVHAKASGRVLFALIGILNEWQSMWMRCLPIDTSLTWYSNAKNNGSADALRQELTGKKAIIPRRSFMYKYFCN